MFDLIRFKKHTACITSTGDIVSYEELQVLTERIRHNISSHQLVFCLCGNNIASIAGYVAFVNNNNATLLLDANVEKESFDVLHETYRPRYIWAPDSFVNAKEAHQVYSELGYSLWILPENNTAIADNLSLLLTTSGSTGSPKLVRLSKTNLFSNAESIIKYLQLTSEERPVTSLPMYYSFGLSIINSHLLVGATILLTDLSYIQREFWQFANENEFTSISGVPYTFEILKKLKFWSMSMPSLRTLTQAGGKLSNELLTYFIDKASSRGIKFYLMYGQTEATARMSYLDPEYCISKLGSIGKGIPGGSFSLIDDDGNVIDEPEVTGELVYTGENVSLGYAECASDLTLPDDNKGVLFTGDLAYKDSDGFYYIVGRKKRFLKLFGNRISLDYIETLLMPLLNECVCVGNDSKLIVYTTDLEYDADSVIDMIVNRTKILRTVFQVRHIDVIPRSETGKIQYKQLPID